MEARITGVRVIAGDICGNRDSLGLPIEELERYDCKNVNKKMDEIYRFLLGESTTKG